MAVVKILRRNNKSYFLSRFFSNVDPIMDYNSKIYGYSTQKGDSLKKDIDRLNKEVFVSSNLKNKYRDNIVKERIEFELIHVSKMIRAHYYGKEPSEDFEKLFMYLKYNEFNSVCHSSDLITDWFDKCYLCHFNSFNTSDININLEFLDFIKQFKKDIQCPYANDYDELNNILRLQFLHLFKLRFFKIKKGKHHLLVSTFNNIVNELFCTSERTGMYSDDFILNEENKYRKILAERYKLNKDLTKEKSEKPQPELVDFNIAQQSENFEYISNSLIKEFYQINLSPKVKMAIFIKLNTIWFFCNNCSEEYHDYFDDSQDISFKELLMLMGGYTEKELYAELDTQLKELVTSLNSFILEIDYIKNILNTIILQEFKESINNISKYFITPKYQSLWKDILYSKFILSSKLKDIPAGFYDTRLDNRVLNSWIIVSQQIAEHFRHLLSKEDFEILYSFIKEEYELLKVQEDSNIQYLINNISERKEQNARWREEERQIKLLKKDKYSKEEESSPRPGEWEPHD